MKLRDGRTAEQRLDALAKWHPYFAWHFVTLNNGDVRWLQTVERRLRDGKVIADFDGLIKVWEYRELNTID